MNATIIDRKTYHRKCVGPCRCTLLFDGQKQLPFNLDNIHLLDYTLLFSYLHAFIEIGCPVAAMSRILEKNICVIRM